MLATIVLATTLAQAWPAPPPYYPPPPPRQYYVPPPPPPPPPPQYYAPPPPPPPQYYAPQPPPAVPPAGPFSRPRYEEPRRLFGLVWMPLAGSTFYSAGYPGGDFGHGQLALEVRGRDGGGRFRLGWEYASYGQIGEIGFKYDFNEEAPLRPFLSAGAGAAWIDGNGVWRLCASVGGGLDYYLARNVFLSFELRSRGFSQPDPPSLFEARGSGLVQTTAMFGIGLFL